MILEPDDKKIRLRPHMVDYEQSMAQACYIEEAKDVLSYIHCYQPELRPQMRDIAQRYFGPDTRNGWRSWLISLRATPVLWTDKQVPDIETLRPLSEISGVHLPID